MKGQASPIIGGLTATMILISQVGLLILTDLPGPPNPPGLPSLRGSQRDSAIDLESTTAFTAEEPPRISRREADKVYISPWPKHQNLGVWQSDLIKSVCLAANDGDRAAWESLVTTSTQAEP